MRVISFLFFLILFPVTAFSENFQLHNELGPWVFPWGGNSNITFARSIVSLGDIDLVPDGKDDFVVTHYQGTSVILYSEDSSGTLIQKWTRTIGGTPNLMQDQTVARISDINGDGADDVIVGSPFMGDARILSGRTGAVLKTFSGSAGNYEFGAAVTGLPDVNGNSIPDFMVTEGGGAGSGSVRVYDGSSSSNGSPLYCVNETGPIGCSSALSDYYFGRAISEAGDVNNDGNQDFMVASRNAVYLFSGNNGSLIHSFSFTSLNTDVRSLDSVGDVDGDGYDDIMVGGEILPGSGGYADGGAQVLSIREDVLGNNPVLFSWSEATSFSRFGHIVRGRADLNNDGVNDFIVGAPVDKTIGNQSGLLRAFSGVDGSVLDSFHGGMSNWTGYSATMGDVNGDGIADVITGSALQQGFGGFLGSFNVYTVHCGSINNHGLGCQGSYGFSPTLSTSGCLFPGANINVSITGPKGRSFILYSGLNEPTGGSCLEYSSMVLTGNIPGTLGFGRIALAATGPGGGIIVGPGTGGGGNVGTVNLSFPVPQGIPSGSVFFQAAFLDQAGTSMDGSTNIEETVIN